MSKRKKRAFIIVLAALLIACIVSSCDAPRPVGEYEINKSLGVIKNELETDIFKYEEFQKYEKTSSYQLYFQLTHGQYGYLEKAKSYIKYNKDGKSFIIENGIKREDTSLDVDNLANEIQVIDRLIGTIISRYEKSQITASGWPEEQKYILTYNASEEDIVKFKLGQNYDSMKINTCVSVREDRILYFYILIKSSTTSDILTYTYGDLNSSMVIDFPEDS
jgi:hypothetical protein